MVSNGGETVLWLAKNEGKNPLHLLAGEMLLELLGGCVDVAREADALRAYLSAVLCGVVVDETDMDLRK